VSKPGPGLSQDISLLAQLAVLTAQAAKRITLLARQPSLRWPSSRSACLIQPWMVAAHGSNSLASASTLRPVRASSTICPLNSAGYGFLVLGMKNTLLHKRKSALQTGELQGASTVTFTNLQFLCTFSLPICTELLQTIATFAAKYDQVHVISASPF
jgi:hypothetical protein